MFDLYSVLFYCIKQICAVLVPTFVGSELVPYCCVCFVLVLEYIERKPNRCRCIFFNFHIMELVLGRGGSCLIFLSNNLCVSGTIGADSDLGLCGVVPTFGLGTRLIFPFGTTFTQSSDVPVFNFSWGLHR